MLRAMPSRLWEEWCAFSLLSPIGDKRGDMQAAMVALRVAELGRGNKTKFSDHLLTFYEERRRKSWADLVAPFRAMKAVAKRRRNG